MYFHQPTFGTPSKNEPAGEKLPPAGSFWTSLPFQPLPPDKGEKTAHQREVGGRKYHPRPQGGGFAVLNFFLLGLTVQKMAGDPNEKKGKLVLQLSYSLRMLATLAVVVLGVKLACFSWVATVIPLLFPRLTILAMQILGMYKPPKNKEGGDEPV